jgi:hypothetical protein
MTTPATPSSPTPAGERNVVVLDDKTVEPSFEYKLQQFWKNNGKIVMAVCVVILLAILAKGGFELYQAQQEKGIEDEYAAASTPEKLKTFATAHAGHALAGVAQLRMADDDYTAGKFADALTSYEKASAILKTGPLAARAQLGTAMAKIGAGKAAEGEATLKQLSGDANQLKAIRAEATYHLTSLAAEAGRADDVAKYSDLVMQIDANTSWAQRAMALRASLPVAPAPAPIASPAAAAPGVQVKVPGKE